MGQLLMCREAAPLAPSVLPEGYTLHTFYRDGKNDVSLAWFREEWTRVVTPDIPVPFENYYDDDRIPADGIYYITGPEGNLVATATVQLNVHEDGTGTVHMVATDPAHRGKGLGSAVSAAVTAHCDRIGLPRTYLTTDEWRPHAVILYRKLGFVPVIYEDGEKERWDKMLTSLGLEICPYIYPTREIRA